MPYGSGPVIRQVLMGATPWQRNLIGAAMVVGGVVLVALGRVTGALLAVAGALLLWRMIRTHLGRPRATPESGPPRERA